MTNKKIYFFIGTTAEFIKLAPVIKELKRRKLPFKLITSGQTRVRFEDLLAYTGPVHIDIALDEKAQQSSIPLFLLWTIKTLFVGIFTLHKEFKNLDKKNCYFIVHGDTVSALIGAIFGRVLGLQLVHVEAGLRSFNFFEPFPEEICKFVINYLSQINFCPNEWSLNNLKNVPGKKVNTKQNTLIEVHWWAINQKKGIKYMKKFNKYYILIIHRQEHVYFNKKWTRNMLKLVIENANKNLNCIFIMHALTSRFLESESLNINSKLGKRLFLVPRLSYLEFMTLMNNAEFIATDGCTNEEEAYYLGLPLLSLRNLTERVEGKGENNVISKGNKNIVINFLKNYKKYRRQAVLFDERPSNIIVEYLLNN